MQPDEMTQHGAVERAWRAAETADEMLRALGDREGSRAYGWLAQTWAAVAGELPMVTSAARERVAVPVPRPLREHEQVVEQRAAADALLGVDPLDPRARYDDESDTIVLDAAHEPIAYAGDTSTCRRCSQPIEWRGGVWIDIVGRGICVAR